MSHRTLVRRLTHPSDTACRGGQHHPGLRLRALVVAAASLFAGAGQAQSVLPTGGSVVGGNAVATIKTTGNAMSIQQSAQNAIINWNTFSIGSPNSVQFFQPNATAITLNRVQGNSPSQIFGNLSANGRIFIVNPNGVLFGNGSSVSVGGLVASTLSISDSDFTSGAQTGSFRFTGGATAPGTVVNQGSLSASGGGTVALIGTATNAAGASITANGGTVALADADVVTLDLQGDGLTLISVSGASLSQLLSVANAGTLQADGGRVSLQAIGATDAQQLVVNQTGVIRARSLQGSAGQIVLDSGSDGTAEVSGTLDASATTAGVAGGTIQLSGERINLGRTATTINAGGDGGANGSLQVLSDADLNVVSGAAIPPAGGSSSNGGSYVADSAVASALNNNTNVTLSARGTASTDSFNSFAGNVVFNGASIGKTSGGDAGLQVEAARNISLNGTSIASSSGALRIGFDSNSANSSVDRNGLADSGGGFLLSQSSIASNGGDIAVYGQNNAVNGRASSGPGATAGISIDSSTISTCSASGCTGGTGAITLRGAGSSSVDSNNDLTSTDAITITGSQINSSSGNITADGIGGIGANGLSISQSSLASASGTVSLSGQSQSQATGDAATLDSGQAAGSGLSIAQSSISTGGNIVLQGQGADLSASLSHLGSLSSQDASNGVVLTGASITAGTGHGISITATAGSAGQTGNSSFATPLPSYAVEQGPAPGQSGGSLAASGGSVTIDGSGGDVLLGQAVDVSSASGSGGTISISGQDVALLGGSLNAAGASGGGTVNLQATQSAVVDAASSINASATSFGNGGQISVGGSSTRAYGTLSARGGATGGNGGRIETSGSSGLDTTGATIDASAAKGQAGTWIIDPFDVSITHSSATGTLPASGVFTPVASTTLQDSDIGRTLSTGTSVQITTGGAGAGAAGAGAITLQQGVDIEKSGGGDATLEFDAATSINGSGFTIASTAGALSVNFNASALAAGNGGIQLSSGQVLSNGGSVRLYGQGDPLQGFAGSATQGIALLDMNIDTRTGQANAGNGGAIVIRGSAQNVQAASGTVDGVAIASSSLDTGAGSISITGRSSAGNGLSLSGLGQSSTPTALSTTSGAITLYGEGSGSIGAGNVAQSADGIQIGGAGVSTQSGALTLDGRGLGVAGTTNNGIEIDNGGSLGSAGSATAMQLNGMSSGGGAGIALNAGSVINAGPTTVVLRASNDGSAETLPMAGTVTGSGAVELRPGTVDASFTASDLVNQTISIGSGGNFVISPASLARIGAGTLVIGSNAQAGAIALNSPTSLNEDFTLESNGGAITLAAPLTIGSHTLALIAGGDISQSNAGFIIAQSLEAVSLGGNVILASPGNLIQPDTLAGSAAGNFTFVNANAIGIGNLNAVGIDAASYGPLVIPAKGITAGGNLLVQALQGNLSLNAPVSGVSIDLVDAGVFLNPGANAINATAGWRVWSQTFSGESRGGLGGTGAPNIYGCVYGQVCAVAISAADDHFIYTTQPTLTITLGNASRPLASANPPFTYTVSGLVNGDTAANALSGSPYTTAVLVSAPGNYPINGAFASPANYALNIVGGTLTISPGFFAQTPETERALLNSYFYDLNLGSTPICPTESLNLGVDSGRGDDLTRQWFLVHTRPRLSSCVQTEKTNSCSADF